MNQLLFFMTNRRKAIGLTVGELASITKMSRAMLYKYLSGKRPLPRERAELLRGALCKTPDDLSQFDSLYSEPDSPIKRRPDAALEIESAFSTLRVATLRYLPFSGAPANSKTEFAFMEKFVARCMSLAVIQVQEISLGTELRNGAERFDMRERINAIECGNIQLVYNLISLQRLKNLSFLSTPIRVAMNAVVLQDYGTSLDKNDEPRVRAARKLLISGKQPEGESLLVMTIRHEVGHVYMERSHQLVEAQQGFQSGMLGSACLKPEESLDPKQLSETLKSLNLIRPTMLVCDEHTALGVVLALGGSGMLVMPPSSDQAIIHSFRRRATPAYYFGIGMRRANNWPLVELLTKIFSTFLSLESETIAELYAELYEKLVSYIHSCLEQTGIYIGGVRRTTSRQGDDPPLTADSTERSMWVSERITMVDQHARAVARRYLSLSQRTIDDLSPELRHWKPILLRARERIQIKEGADRGRIRNIIIYCAKIALGDDPLKVNVRPIALIQRLWTSVERNTNKAGSGAEPAGGHDEGGYASLSPFDNGSAVSAEGGSEIDEKTYWDDFLYLLARELDIDADKLQGLKRTFAGSSTLGKFISEVQTRLEASRDSQLVITIQKGHKYSETQLQELISAWAQSMSKGDMDVKRTLEANLNAELSKPDSPFKIDVAYNLGEAVGFIVWSTEAYDVRIAPEWNIPAQLPGAQVIRVRCMYASRRIHESVARYRLIRQVVEEGNNTGRAGVLLNTAEWGSGLEAFTASGFHKVGGGVYLGYQFRLL